MIMKKIIFVSALLAVFCSCTKENTLSQSSEKLFPITIEVADADEEIVPDDADVKAWTYSAGNGIYKFRWVDDEKVAAFDSKADVTGGHEFTTSGKNGNKITISGSVCPDATGQVVLMSPMQTNSFEKNTYKYSTNYDVTNKKITMVKIPYNYAIPKPDFMDGQSLNRVGILSSKDATGEKVNMYNPFAAVAFTLKNCSVNHKVVKVELIGSYGEQLGGYCDINISDAKNPKVEFIAAPYLSSSPQQVAYDITWTKKDDEDCAGTIFVNGTYISSLAPVTFSKGLTLKFTDDKGNVAFKSSSNELTIARNHIKNLGTIDVETLPWHFAMDLHFQVCTYNKGSIPFNEALITTKNTVNTQHFTLKDGSGKVVEFKVFCPADYSEIGFYDGGFNLKGTGAYIEIPAIEGKVLKQIWFRVASTDGYCGDPTIVRASDGYYLTKNKTFESGSVNADTWEGKKKYGWYKIWKDAFVAGESYRIQLTRDDNGGASPKPGSEGLKVHNLVLLYDDAPKAATLNVNSQVNDWDPAAESDALMY